MRGVPIERERRTILGVIAFGVAISNRREYEEVALPGIRRVAEDDSRILTRVGYDSIQRPYNEMLDEVASLPGLEALVLMHQDLELTDDTLLSRIRAALRDQSVGIVGVLGFRGFDPQRWRGPGGGAGRSAPIGFRTATATTVPAVAPAEWEGPLVGHRYSEGPEEVELVDGILMALAPWVVRSIRYDERLAKDFHGYDADLSLRVRAAGGRLIVAPVPHVHHQSRAWRSREEFVRARRDFADRWDPDLRPPEWAAAFEV